MDKLKIITYNVNGVGCASNKKCRRLFNYLHTLKVDLIILQETHCTAEDEKRWKAEWRNIIFINGTSVARGIAMLFGKCFNPKIIDFSKDNIARTLVLSVSLLNRMYAIAGIYAPNEDDVHYFADVFIRIDNLNCELCIVLGDFNTVLNIDLDIEGGRGCSNKKTRNFLNEIIFQYELVEVWRVNHKDEFQATFARKKPHPLKERIDYVLMSGALQQNVEEIESFQIIIQ